MSAKAGNSKYHLYFGLFGILMGFTIARIGFGDYNEVHNLFTLADFRILLTFALAVIVAMIGFAVFARGKSLPKKKIHPGTAIGGVLFGTGWAITGACPSIALVQMGVGYVPAIATGVGIFAGAYVYKHVHARFFRWDSGSCEV